jgi:hypothetical protein
MPPSLVRIGLVGFLALALVAGCRESGPSLAERAAAAKAAEEAADAKAREETRAKLEAQRIAALWPLPAGDGGRRRPGDGGHLRHR